jgi:hypothetical protein
MTKRVTKSQTAADAPASTSAKKSAPKRKKKAAPPPETSDTATTPTAAKAPDLSHITGDLRPLAVPIRGLIRDTRNARTHERESITAIVASLREYGQRKPIVVNRRNKKIEAGYGTVTALLKLKKTHVAAVFVEDDDETHYGFAIADNRTAELSNWNHDALESLLTEYGLHEKEGTLWEDLMLEHLQAGQKVAGNANGAAPSGDRQEIEVPKEYTVIVECESEADQKAVYDSMKSQGRKCRVLTI